MGGVVLTALLSLISGKIAKEKMGDNWRSLLQQTIFFLFCYTTNKETSLICYEFVTKMICYLFVGYGNIRVWLTDEPPPD